jgi:hypothetical protein
LPGKLSEFILALSLRETLGAQEDHMMVAYPAHADGGAARMRRARDAHW